MCSRISFQRQYWSLWLSRFITVHQSTRCLRKLRCASFLESKYKIVPKMSSRYCPSKTSLRLFLPSRQTIYKCKQSLRWMRRPLVLSIEKLHKLQRRRKLQSINRWMFMQSHSNNSQPNLPKQLQVGCKQPEMRGTGKHRLSRRIHFRQIFIAMHFFQNIDMPFWLCPWLFKWPMCGYYSS